MSDTYFAPINCTAPHSDLHRTYFGGSIVTMLGSLFVIGTYSYLPALRKHPSELIFWRCIFDFLFGLHFFCLFFVTPKTYCENCESIGPFVLFCFLASQGYFAASTYALRQSMKNPFQAPESIVYTLHFIVLGVSGLAAIVMRVSGGSAYRPALQFCFVRQTRRANQINFLNGILVYLPIGCLILYSIFVLYYARNRLSEGLPSTFDIRIKTLEDGYFYTGVFTVYWVIAGILYLVIFSFATYDTQSNRGIYTAFAFVVALLGIVDFLMWFWRKFWNSKVLGLPPPSPSLRSEGASKDNILIRVAAATMHDASVSHTTINLALRREVLDFTTNGIAKSVEKAAEQAADLQLRPNERPPIVHYPTSLNDDPDATTAINAFPLEITDEMLELENDESANTSPNLHQRISRQRSSYGDDSGDRLFTDYAPHVFRYLRTYICELTDESYIASLVPKTQEQRNAVADAKYSEGRSGAFFYFSHDSRFIVKTVTKDEARFFLTSVLPNYVNYLFTHKNSLINKFLGLHSLKMYDLTLYFVVMENIFLADLKPHETYDLKGSWVDRSTHHGVEAGKLMKDSDLRKQIVLSKHFRERLLTQLEADSAFLKSQNIMDYSMLLGIYHVKISIEKPEDLMHDGNEEEKSNRSQRDVSLASDGKRDEMTLTNYNGGVRASVIEGPGIYYMGIIDTLQEWNFGKKVERWFKMWIRRKDGNGISCVEPAYYADRFMMMMENITTTDSEYYRSKKVPTHVMFDNEEKVFIFPPEAMIENTINQIRNRSFLGAESNGIGDQEPTAEDQSLIENEG